MCKNYCSKLFKVLEPLWFVIGGISMFFIMYWTILLLPSVDQVTVAMVAMISIVFGLIQIGFFVAYENFTKQQTTDADNSQCEVTFNGDFKV